MTTETYLLAPSRIADRARQLASTGLYEQALQLLSKNCVEATVNATSVEMRLARELNGKVEQERVIVSGRISRANRRRVRS